MRNRKIWKNFSILLIAVVMISSIAAAQTVTTEKNDEPNEMFSGRLTEPITVKRDMGCNRIRFVVWDNWMDSDNLLRAHFNETAPFDAYPADDFQFEEKTEVYDVHWLGGYWWTGYQQGDCDWNIIFYEDDEGIPGDLFAGPFTYSQAQCNPKLLGDTGYAIFYEFSVNLSEYITFPADSKFWISIYAIGNTTPYAGWGIHEVPIKLNQGVIKSDSFGYPDWTNLSETSVGYAADMCFQLTTVVDYRRPRICIVKPMRAVYFRDSKLFNRLIGIPTIIGDITIEVKASDAQTGIEKVEFYGGLCGKEYLGNDTTAPYNFTWKKDRIRLIYIQTLKVVAYDKAGNVACKRMLVRKIL